MALTRYHLLIHIMLPFQVLVKAVSDTVALTTKRLRLRALLLSRKLQGRDRCLWRILRVQTAR